MFPLGCVWCLMVQVCMQFQMSQLPPSWILCWKFLSGRQGCVLVAASHWSQYACSNSCVEGMTKILPLCIVLEKSLLGGNAGFPLHGHLGEHCNLWPPIQIINPFVTIGKHWYSWICVCVFLWLFGILPVALVLHVATIWEHHLCRGKSEELPSPGLRALELGRSCFSVW